MLNKRQINQAMHIIIDMYPQAGPSLNADNNFQYLIAVTLSAQTTDAAVNKVTEKLFSKYPTPDAMSKADIIDVEKIIHSIGLYHNKAKHAIACSKMLVNDYQSVVPNKKSELIKLPGVGVKTANVELGDCFGFPSFAVDTHVSKISKRLHFVKKDAKVGEIEKKITASLEPKYWIHGHHAMIELGRAYNFHDEKQIENLPVVIQCDKWNKKINA